jgi:hypothetical protein
MYNTYEILNKDGKVSQVRGIQPPNETIREAVKTFVTYSKQEKEIKKNKDEKAEILRDFIKNVRDFFTKKGDFNKSYRIEEKEGNFVYAVDIIATEKYSLPTKKEDIEKLKKELTAGIFNQFFEIDTVIRIKDLIANDKKKRNELIKTLIDILGEDKVKEYFVKEEVLNIKEDFMSKINQLSQEQKDILFKYIKPSLDMVKDTSYQIKE